MKHLDTLLEEITKTHLQTLQGEAIPVAQLMDWCKEDQDRAIVACFEGLYGTGDDDLFDAFCEAYPDHPIEDMHNKIEDVAEEIYSAHEDGRKPDIDYKSLYLPLEHIINDRIDLYNRS